MQNPLRITIVTRSLMIGGTQRHIVKLCQELAEKDISISICLLINDEPQDLISELPSHIRVHVFPYRRHDCRTVFWLANVVRNERSQIVHSFSWHADFYASFLKLLIPGLVVLASERGDRGDQGFYRAIYNLVDRLIVFRLVDGFCANSLFGKRLLFAKGYKSKKIWAISNGIQLSVIDAQPKVSVRKIYDWPASSTLCCIVSRLVDYKGIDAFIRHVKSCKQDIRVVIVGDGPQRQYLTSLIDDLSLNDQVAWAGQRNPATPYVKDADVCVLPTNKDTEHCSNSILEYMACAKPVIALDVAGNAELVVAGVTGFLGAPQRMQEVSVALDQLAADQNLAKRMGLAGRKRIEEYFQMSDIAARFCSLWKLLVQSKIS